MYWCLHMVSTMPCTENVDANDMDRARRLIENSVPDGYRLINFYPTVQTGRNPHRWQCTFERIDGVYSYDCDYLTATRTSFKRDCPAGCEVSQLIVAATPNRRFIQVSYLVNCGCRRTARTKRSFHFFEKGRCTDSNVLTFQRERSTCSGISHA